MNAPTVLPWHQSMAQEHYQICKAHYYAGAVAMMSESIALNYARLEAQRAETLRLLKEAHAHLYQLYCNRVPFDETGHLICEIRNHIDPDLVPEERAHLAAQKGSK